MAPIVHILFPTFDKPESARSLVRQLAGQTYRDFDVFCVDHGTAPVDFQPAERERLTVVRAGAELWWTGAMNAGLERILASAGDEDAVLTINDDVEIGPDFLGALVAATARQPRALVGSACVDLRIGRLRYADLQLDVLAALVVSRHAGRSTDELPPGGALPCDVLSCRGTLIPVRAFRDVGLFDARRLPHYTADYEFSWRARRAGYRLVCAADARVGTDWGRRGTAKGDLVGYLLDRRRPGNLPATYEFARLCFGGPYALWFTALAGARLLAGFVLEKRGPR